MLPLTLAQVGTAQVIQKIGGSSETKKHLENLGFVMGDSITVVCTMGGNVIVKVKDARIAVSKELATKIMV